MRNTTLSLDVLHVCYMRETVRWRITLPSFPTANLEVRVVIPVADMKAFMEGGISRNLYSDRTVICHFGLDLGFDLRYREC